MDKKPHFLSPRRICLSFIFAFKGIYGVMRYEANMQVHLLFTVLVILLGFFTQLDTAEWCRIIFAIAFVWVSELFNSSIETLVDLVQDSYHPLAAKVKDIAAGAVVIAVIAAVFIGVITFLPKLISIIVL